MQQGRRRNEALISSLSSTWKFGATSGDNGLQGISSHGKRRYRTRMAIMRIYRRSVAALALLLIFCVLLLLTFRAIARNRDEIDVLHLSENEPPRQRQLHLLVPATGSNLYLCQLLLTATLAGYPEPVLLGLGNDREYRGTSWSYIFKISETLNYLNSLPTSADNDIALMLDAYDVWFLVRPEVLISRYFDVIEQANARLRKRSIHGIPTGGERVRDSVLFGADKLCYPTNDTSRPACGAVPNPPTPEYPRAVRSRIPYESVPPRWLNSGTIMGPVKDLGRVFSATMALVEQRHDLERPEWRVMDQLYFSDIWGLQEVERTNLEARAGASGWLTSPSRILNFNRGQNIEPTEYHITVDYAEELFQTAYGNSPYLIWQNFSNLEQVDDEEESRALAKTSRAPAFPEDIASSRPPFSPEALEADLPQNAIWQNLRLGVNIATRRVFALFHMTVEKQYRDEWWPQLWFHPHSKALFEAARHMRLNSISKYQEPLENIAYVHGVQWVKGRSTYEAGEDNWEDASAWDVDGKPLHWQRLCGSYNDSLFLQ
ncbi:hypothetical protein LTR37_005469 [Vermiconidia calcicola]|uniref:Uncharacterized protein n=1 Tax=Vermiconidia calcicola TaxID=1690605 RepID=A0ACC3NM82_9PEZI|nr:hypothetical protein LTR37_005469 [Vermiconidia calcicola]